MDFFRNLHVDSISFWLGFIGGILFAWVLSRLRTYLPATIQFIRKQIQQARESASASSEFRLRTDTIRIAQQQHLAAVLFSLDEVAVEPAIIVPPIYFTDENEYLPSDAVSTTLPYAPDWPEVAATYNAPTFTLAQALVNGSNILLSGHPGSGKSFALAHLASLIGKQDPSLRTLANHIPLYIHAANLSDLTENISALDTIIETLSNNVTKLPLSRLRELVITAFDCGRALLIIDGLDEMTPENARRTTNLIHEVLDKHPKTQIITTASHDNHFGLPALGFQPVSIASWTFQKQIAFVQNWGQLWNRFINTPGQNATAEVNHELLNKWLTTKNVILSPLELTLKVWSAYAGDMLGTDILNTMESYIRRMSINIPQAHEAIEKLSLQMVCATKLAIRLQDATECLSQFKPVEQAAPEATDSVEVNPENERAESVEDITKVKLGSVLPGLIENGLVVQRAQDRVSLVHPIFTGYLASQALAKVGNPSAIADHPEWIGKSLALQFYAHFGDIGQIAQEITSNDNLIHRQTLAISHWLPFAPKKASWRASLLRNLAGILNKEYQSLSLGIRIIAAIALSEDPGAGMLFRQMLKSDQTNLRQLAALGCGLLQDVKSIADLEYLTNDPSPATIKAACLALVAIGTRDALDVLATSLLQGSETLRRAAAEALANHPEEGHPALREGSEMADLMVRRAIVYGLMRVNKPWAHEILERLSLEDKEWIVRNSAIQALEEIRSPNPYSPKLSKPLEETPWLVEFAAKLGLGVTPGKPAQDLVFQALQQGNEEQKLRALGYLRTYGGDESVHHLYKCYFGTSGEVHESTYDTLWHLNVSGLYLPSPQQYGMA